MRESARHAREPELHLAGEAAQEHQRRREDAGGGQREQHPAHQARHAAIAELHGEGVVNRHGLVGRQLAARASRSPGVLVRHRPYQRVTGVDLGEAVALDDANGLKHLVRAAGHRQQPPLDRRRPLGRGETGEGRCHIEQHRPAEAHRRRRSAAGLRLGDRRCLDGRLRPTDAVGECCEYQD
jgi:hypothetical protein